MRGIRGAAPIADASNVTPNWHGMVEFGLVGLLVLLIILRLILRG